MGVNCRLIACSRLRDSRARGIEKPRTRRRRRGRGGAAHAFHFRVFPILSRLSHYLRAWNRLVDTRHIELKEEPKVKHLNWLTCNFASFAALDCTGFARITMFATVRNCFFRLPFLWDHLTGMRYSLFRGWTRLFIIPNPNIHYSFSFKPCYYSLFSFHPQNIWYNQLLSNWLPINYLLITHWFHWCHRLVSSRVSSGKRRLLCGRPAKLTGMSLEGGSGCTERVSN